MKLNTPVRSGSYDDAGMISDAQGNELFSVGQNEDTHEMTPAQKELAVELCKGINGWDEMRERRGFNQSQARVIAEQGKELDLARELLNKMVRSGVDNTTIVDDLRSQARYLLKLIQEEV